MVSNLGPEGFEDKHIDWLWTFLIKFYTEINTDTPRAVNKVSLSDVSLIIRKGEQGTFSSSPKPGPSERG